MNATQREPSDSNFSQQCIRSYHNEWNRTESPEINPQIYSHWFQQWCQDNLMGVKIVFLTNDAGTTGYPHAKERNRTPTSDHI